MTHSMDTEEKELLKKCTPALNLFANYFKENELGKKVYESAKPHIYDIEYIGDLNTKKVIFKIIIKHYYGKDKEYEYLEKAMLNYFMIQFTGNHERYFSVSKSYGQQMYDNLRKYAKTDLYNENDQCKLYLDYNESAFATYNKIENALVDGELQARKCFKISTREKTLYYMYNEEKKEWEPTSDFTYYLLNSFNKNYE